MQNRRDEAIARYQQVLAIDPRAAVAANNLAWLLAEKGERLDEALQLAQTAKSQLPDVAEINDTLGYVYHKKGMSSMAVPPLREAAEKDPANGIYHYHLGLALAASGDKPGAASSFKRALAATLSPEQTAEVKSALASVQG
jgi:tetratricopeptide (TPR) repeat protein